MFKTCLKLFETLLCGWSLQRSGRYSFETQSCVTSVNNLQYNDCRSKFVWKGRCTFRARCTLRSLKSSVLCFALPVVLKCSKLSFKKCWLTPVNRAISIKKPTIILFWYHAKSTIKMITSKSFCSDSLWNIILKCEKLLMTERSRGVFLSEIWNTVIRLKFNLVLIHELAKWFHFFSHRKNW